MTILSTHGSLQLTEHNGSYRVGCSKGSTMPLVTKDYLLAMEYFLQLKNAIPAATDMAQ